MLLDAALKFATMAAEGMDNKDHERVYEGFTNARNIVLELNSSIKGGIDPELTKKVKDIYTFIYGELLHSSIEKDRARLGKVIELLEYERETWAQYLEKIKLNQSDAASNATANYADRPSLSIQA